MNGRPFDKLRANDGDSIKQIIEESYTIQRLDMPLDADDGPRGSSRDD